MTTKQGQCIMGKLSRDDNYMLKVDATDAPFSVSRFHLSTSRETDVLIEYEMADGSSCRQVAHGTPEGSDVNNDQCGGAVSVKFMLPEESKFGECDLIIHEIGFDCSSGPKVPTLPEPSPSSSITTASHIRHSTSAIDIPSTSDFKSVITSTEWTTAEMTVTNCPPAATYCPAHSTVVVSSTYTMSTTECPSESAKLSTATHSTSTVTPATHSISTVTVAMPSSSIVSPPCPKLVPKCINTWLAIPNCHSNSDAACFCPSSEFTEKVGSCIRAWGNSKEKIESALSYFAGICAPYVQKNTGIIEIVPTSTSQYSFTQTTADRSEPPATTSFRGETSSVMTTPVTTSFRATSEVPETTVTWSSHTMTCPKVGFSTFTHGSTTTVALVVPSSPAITSSETKHSALPSSSSNMTTPCKTPSSFSTHPGPKPTETTHYSSSGSKKVIGSVWMISFFILYLG